MKIILKHSRLLFGTMTCVWACLFLSAKSMPTDLNHPELFGSYYYSQIFRSAQNSLSKFGQEVNQSPGASTTKPLRTIRVTSLVRSIAISPDGKIIVSGNDQGEVQLWNRNTEKLLYTFLRHSNWIQSVVFSPDGKLIASGSIDGTIKLWNLSTKKLIRTFEKSQPVYSLTFSPDGKLIASGNGGGIIRLWDLNGKSIRNIKAHSGNVVSVVISPDGKTLASRSFVSISNNNDTDIKLWNLSTGNLIRALTAGETGGVNSLAISSDGNILAGYFSIQTAEAIRLWNFKTKEVIATLDVGINRPHAIALAPDSTTLAVGGFSNQIQIWNLSTRQKLRTFISDISNSQTYSLAFSLDRQTLVSAGSTGSGGFITLWQVTPNSTPSEQL